MTTEDKLKAYKEGFKDGFAEGYKQGKADANPLNPYKDVLKDYPPFMPQPYDYTAGCRVCGRTGPDLLVCYHPNCPSRITFTTSTTSHDMGTGAIGAAGSSIQSTLPLGANGPTGK